MGEGTDGAHPFGTTSTGEPVHRVQLSAGGLTANIITWGAAVQDLRLSGHAHPLVLGYPDFASYERFSPHFGATPGRFAGRIDRGRFTLDGETVQLDRNEGENHLHGGTRGTSRRVWTIADLSGDSVRLELDDPDGHAGYPGDCRLSCTYTLTPAGALAVTLTAETDRPTIVNLTNHSYFTLDDSASIVDHELEMAAEAYLPTRPDQIPTGEIRSVDGTPFDFRRMRPIRLEEDGEQVLYDHAFCLSRERGPVRRVASVRSPRSGVRLDVSTSEPGLVFYMGFKLKENAPGLDGMPYGPCAGLCLEAQGWPDAPNHSAFPSVVLRPGERLVQHTEYAFSRG
ncbi:aldose epimerase family protein [Pararhizobium mangrovi]|uniref:Aldose 1-epimerase n=1 Tax=Pararhizobium mangrovi TaxID=2590452 RepID=A0A506UA16_9HYPH|nr:aldose epimerase family protein [Pararhizobium mangrovi]TPW30720.1 galactose mutarotase [Pararhizobium mangrovi]